MEINDLIITKALDTAKEVAHAYIVYKSNGEKQQADIQQQQVAMDGLGFLSDLFGRFLNQQHGDNILQYLMQFVDKLPKKQPSEPNPQPQPEPKQEITTMGSPEE